MSNIIQFPQAMYRIGQIIVHNRFHYRGVIFEIDPNFRLTQTWYEHVAKTRPPKDKPWYHVLVDNSVTTTYVAERNVSLAEDCSPLRHPLINRLFSGLENNRYIKINR